jgi:hypothetical protein
MASSREVVRFRGTLRGKGHEADCVVSAIKVSLPGSGVSAYSRYDIVSLSKSVPDGRYDLSVNGQVIALRYQCGHWLAAQAF